MTILDKIWSGDTVYEEPVCFAESTNFQHVGGNLLYRPSQILTVTSFDRQVLYKAGVDYTNSDKGILLTDRSRIPFLSRKIYCKPYCGILETQWLRLPEGKEYIEPSPDVYRYQVLVTYHHQDNWINPIIESKIDELPITRAKLSNGNDLNLIFYGDSITAGWEASGAEEQVVDLITLSNYPLRIHRAPYMPAWAELVTEALRRAYPQSSIQKFNRAAGGATAEWGYINAAKLVNPYVPDLVILAFGMNSMQMPDEDYRSNIVGIIDTIRSEHPLCEFILVSPMVPNPEIVGFHNNHLARHEQILFELSRTIKGIIVAPVHSLFLEMQNRGKHYLELTGNCINHPNDFSIRIYAQVILSLLGI